MCFHPLRDESYEDAAKEWKEGFLNWEKGTRPEYCTDESKDLEYWEYNGGPPDREYYRPTWKPEEATWYQVYETVSEGTPVSPPFATQDELIEYLVANGDFWDQSRAAEGRHKSVGWSREAAERFVRDTGWAPSMIVSTEHGVESGVEGMAHLKSSDSPPGKDGE